VNKSCPERTKTKKVAKKENLRHPPTGEQNGEAKTYRRIIQASSAKKKKEKQQKKKEKKGLITPHGPGERGISAETTSSVLLDDA